MSSEIKIDKTHRRVIERKLLEALSEGDKVAILATKEDCQVILAALRRYERGQVKAESINVLATLIPGLERLLEEAF